MTTYQDQIKKFRDMQREIMDLSQQLENKKEMYKAEMKAAFGIADGDPANALEIIETVRKVQGMA